MCFNISINKNKYDIENDLDLEFVLNDSFSMTSHIAAFTNPLIPVITSENKNKIELCYWGLIPYWAKDAKKANEIRKFTYNAKSETIFTKPSFKNSIINKKCLILIDGFYEWQSTPSKKICHLITHPTDSIFTLAGIWSDWLDRSTGEYIRSISIITQQANKMMSEIHNIKKRQPVTVNKEDRVKWFLSGKDFTCILDKSFQINFNSKIIDSPL